MTINIVEKNIKTYIWIKPLILLGIVGGLTLITYKTGLIHLFFNKKSLMAFLNSLGPWAFAGFILLQAMQVIVSPIPGEITGLLGGYLYGPFLGVVLSTIGLTLGSYAAFALSRAFGRPFVEKVVSKGAMARFDYLLHHKGAFLVFLLFLLPGFPKDYFCYILGLGHLSTREFIVIGGTGRLFGTVLLTLGGTYIRHHQYTRFFVLMGISVVVVFIAMAYKDKLEEWFRLLHTEGKKKNQ